MAKFRGDKEAFGFPGITPRWTNGAKDGVGTAYSASSRVWFTLWRGILTEVFFPSVDRPQLRDCQYLITDEASFLYEEKRHLNARVERLTDCLGYKVESQSPDGSFMLVKNIICDPHLPSILMNTQIIAEQDTLNRLKLYLLCAPHLAGGGSANNGYVVEVSGREILVAEKNGIWMAIGATVPFSKLSCGFVGASDGWTDLADNYQMDYQFDKALNGNIALTGQLNLENSSEHTVALSFGSSLHHATTSLLQSLSVPFPEQLQRFSEQWRRTCKHLHAYEPVTSDGGKLYRTSCQMLLAHEDKENSGAIIASLSIPWGEANGDEDLGGYHLVWPRDMVNSASALLAAGNVDTALRGLVFLATCQRPDGGFAQNFWIDGSPYWNGIQLDEVAFPIILAWRLHKAADLHAFDPYTMVTRAAKFMIMNGPTTGQDRWEEASGFSPSTLAVNVSAAVCAAHWALYKHDQVTAQFLFDYADYLESHVDNWTSTNNGSLLPGISRHYVRINTASNLTPHLTVDEAMITLANQAPGARPVYPCNEIVDAGFLELVRFGIRRSDDPLVVDSLAVIDAVLKVDTPFGPSWRRYNHDGYGQKEDGTAFTGFGIGRAWPLLTGERGHYELAAGRSAAPYIQALENFACPSGPIPEQVWDSADIPAEHMFLGRPTGSAMPLAWAHGEYIKLVRSTFDGAVFDTIPEVRARYDGRISQRKQLEIWRKNWQIKHLPAGSKLQIHVDQPFVLLWTNNNWHSSERLTATHTGLAIWYVQLDSPADAGVTISFTLFYTDSQQWEGVNYDIRTD